MSPKYFVEIVKEVVQEQAINDMIETLIEPVGHEPPAQSKVMSDFYLSLSQEQKDILKNIIRNTSEMTLFGLFCVLDGVRAIESGEDKGLLELWYRKGDYTLLINNEDEDFLHDLLF